MRRCVALSAIVANLLVMMTQVFAQGASSEIKNIETVVIIYAENRSFDNLYGHFPGADGLANVRPGSSAQVDREGIAARLGWIDRAGRHAAGDGGANQASPEQALRHR
jgi:phospholipase C